MNYEHEYKHVFGTTKKTAIESWRDEMDECISTCDGKNNLQKETNFRFVRESVWMMGQRKWESASVRLRYKTIIWFNNNENSWATDR